MFKKKLRPWNFKFYRSFLVFLCFPYRSPWFPSQNLRKSRLRPKFTSFLLNCRGVSQRRLYCLGVLARIKDSPDKNCSERRTPERWASATLSFRSHSLVSRCLNAVGVCGWNPSWSVSSRKQMRQGATDRFICNFRVFSRGASGKVFFQRFWTDVRAVFVPFVRRNFDAKSPQSFLNAPYWGSLG